MRSRRAWNTSDRVKQSVEPRRTLLEGLWRDRVSARLIDVFDDGHAHSPRSSARPGGHHREAPRRPLSLRLPGLDEGQEPFVLAARVRGRASAATARTGRSADPMIDRCRRA